jgi:hypothetical protein
MEEKVSKANQPSIKILLRRTRGLSRFCPEAGGGKGKVTQIMYTHVSTCKNNKIIKRKKYSSESGICPSFIDYTQPSQNNLRHLGDIE